MTTSAISEKAVARINGIALNTRDNSLTPDELRQRAYTELLRQASQQAGLLAADDPPIADGVIGDTASAAIEALLDQALNIPEPAEDACLRHHAAHEATYRTGERIHLRISCLR